MGPLSAYGLAAAEAFKSFRSPHDPNQNAAEVPPVISLGPEPLILE